MSIIESIAASYETLTVNCPERVKAFGIVYNNTKVGGVTLSQHPAGKRVTAKVLDYLGYEKLSTTAEVKGNLDDFL